MLATPHCMHGTLPHTSSPLSPRSANIYGHYPAAYMEEKKSVSQEQDQDLKPQLCAKKSDWSKRPVKKAPSPKPDELKERRRGMFLRKVREGREDRRWAQRGEDIMRLDFVQRQRRWEAEQAREAPLLTSDPIEEEDDNEVLPTSSSAMLLSQPASHLPTMRDEEVDEVLQREEEEMEALLAHMPGSNEDEHTAQNDHLYSDDDYDALFSEVMDEGGTDGGQAHQQPAAQAQSSEEAMDLS